MSEKLSRRKFLRVAAVGAGALLVASCQPKVVEVEKIVEKEVTKVVKEVVLETVIVEGTPQVVEKEVTRIVKEVVEVEKEVVVAPKPAEPVQLRLAEGSWVGPEGIKFWSDEIIPRFELENSDIKVTFENAEAVEYGDKLFTQIVAGEAPDVMFVWGNLNYNLMLKGQFLVLDEHFDSKYLEDFYPAKLDAHYYDGHLYGLPKYVSTVCTAYNKDILDEAGVDYPDGTWDWDDYRVAYEATTKRDASGAITQWGTYTTHQYVEHYVWMNGGEWMNAKLFGTKCLLDEDKAMEALKYLYDQIYGRKPVSPKSGDVPEYGIHNVFSTGKIAFAESHSWTVTNYIRENDFRWDFTDLPIAWDGTKAGLTFADGYGVAASTKYPEASLKLLEFMTSPWAEKAMCLSIVGLQPTRRSVAHEWDVNSMGALAGYDVAAFSRIMDYARLDPAFKDNEKISEIFSPIWDLIWVTGEMDLEEGVKLMVDRIDEYFATA